jgi:hypothetical protein
MQNNNTNEMYSINANNCGQRPLVSNQTVLKIVGGVQALNGDWPWQIIMFYDGGFTCGGSLINSLWVVTAGKYFDYKIIFKFIPFFNTFRVFSFIEALWSVLGHDTKLLIHLRYV